MGAAEHCNCRQREHGQSLDSGQALRAGTATTWRLARQGSAGNHHIVPLYVRRGNKGVPLRAPGQPWARRVSYLSSSLGPPGPQGTPPLTRRTTPGGKYRVTCTKYPQNEGTSGELAPSTWLLMVRCSGSQLSVAAAERTMEYRRRVGHGGSTTRRGLAYSAPRGWSRS